MLTTVYWLWEGERVRGDQPRSWIAAPSRCDGTPRPLAPKVRS